MFDTDLIVWLQSSSPGWLLPVMLVISGMGDSWLTTPLVLALIFAWRLRPGLAVLLALLLGGVLVTAAKQGFALPRPVDIDSRVLYKGGSRAPIVEHGPATSFWALPSPKAIAAVRASTADSYGFISGHTSQAAITTIATVLCFGVRSRLAWAAALLWPLVMAFSRMYLGRHFLADVLGGLVAAALAVFVARQLVGSASSTRQRRAVLGALVTIMALGLASSAVHWLSPGALGGVAGVLVCLWVLSHFDDPDEVSTGSARATRFLIALGLALAVGWALEGLHAILGVSDRHVVTFLLALVGYPMVLLGTLGIARRLTLYVGPSLATAP